MTTTYNSRMLAQLAQLVKRLIAWLTRDDDDQDGGQGVEEKSW